MGTLRAISAIKLGGARHAAIQRAATCQSGRIRRTAVDALVFATVNADHDLVAARFWTAPQPRVRHPVKIPALFNPLCHLAVQIQGIALRHGHRRQERQESEKYLEHVPLS